MLFERHHICYYPTQISACFLSLSDIYSQLSYSCSSFFFFLSCSLVNSSSKWGGNCVSNSSLAASSFLGMHRSSARKREKKRKRLSNKRKDDWEWRVSDRIKRDRNARRLFSSPSYLYWESFSFFLSFLFNRNEKN